jgi:hypothetical protein
MRVCFIPIANLPSEDCLIESRDVVDNIPSSYMGDTGFDFLLIN